LLPIIDSSTTALLGMAIDAAAMRQQALAQNIANANTPGYQRIGVNFEERVNALMEGNGRVRAASTSELQSFRPYFQIASAEGAGNDVSLDTEVAAMSENTLHHQVLVKALSKHLALIGLAINEGKR
jgi:flagellar basal-body rod protein FlgB